MEHREAQQHQAGGIPETETQKMVDTTLALTPARAREHPKYTVQSTTRGQVEGYKADITKTI